MKRFVFWIKSIFIPAPVFKGSMIKTLCSGPYEISRVYEDLINRSDVKITSVSVTRVDHDGGRGYVNNFMIAVSYDLYEYQRNN